MLQEGESFLGFARIADDASLCASEQASEAVRPRQRFDEMSHAKSECSDLDIRPGMKNFRA
jgi:hypothetical protein